MFCLYQPFMQLWVGGNLMLPFVDMICFCIYFYLITANNIRNLYINGNGLWWRLKYLYIAEAIGNLVLNIALGYAFGIFGILLATIITILVFNFVCRCHILFKYYFIGKSEAGFFWAHFKYFVITVLNAILCYGICSLISLHGAVGLFLKILTCVILPNFFYSKIASAS